MTSAVSDDSALALTGSRKALAALLAAGMAATVGGAIAFEHIGGFIPCALCLQQRIPYYVGIPVAVLAFVSAAMKAPPMVTRGLFLVAGGLMVYGAGLGAYHSGVEWGWWEGPASCGGAGGVTTDATNLLSALNSTQPPSCNEAAGRFLGLSFAGWNVVASLALAAVAFRGAVTRGR